MVTRILLGATALILIMAAAQAQDDKLADLIPTDKWEKTGISKLTDSERGVLREEIAALLQAYRASLTDGLAVIAPSVSTSMKAREIRAQLRKKEVPLRYAEAILVVVRSSLFNPLQYSYDSVGELQRDADNQLNISGPKFHVYLYSMDDNLVVTQTSHRSFDAE
jgi:hypothetical protein